MSSKSNLQGKLGYREYLCIPQDGRRHEIVNGEHVVNPAPNTYHQTLSRRIQFQLFTQIESKGLGEVFNAPTDVQLSETDIVQPDLVVVLARRRTIITPAKIKGTPDLIVEILSESSVDLDRVVKKELYRKSAVPEYWIVAPDEHRVEQFTLKDRAYVLVDRHSSALTCRVVPGVRVDLSEVW